MKYWAYSLLENPLSLWILHLYEKIRVHARSQNIRIGYMSRIDRATVLEEFSSIGKYVKLKQCKVGRCSYVADHANLAHADIGRFCSIASGVKIGGGSHPTDFVSSSPLFYSAADQLALTFVTDSKYDEFSRVTIGNDVWIGANSIVLDGVTIGDGAVVGAGAVITRDVAPYAIVAGVPAKKIRSRFDDETIAGLLSSQWWDRDLSDIKKDADSFLDIDRFLKKMQ